MKHSERGETAEGDERKRVHEYESRFAEAFIAPSRRDRFLHLASSKARFGAVTPGRMMRRLKYDKLLANLECWLRHDVELLAAIPVEELLVHLTRLGAPSECYVMSLKREADGRFLSLSQAVRELSFGDNDSTLLICRPDALAYYWHGEIQDASAILRANGI